MRLRTAVAVTALLAVLLAALGAGLSTDRGNSPTLTTTWVSDTGGAGGGNHHAVAAGRVEGIGLVYAPISRPTSAAGCALYALWASNGTTSWRHPVPTRNCTVHAVADPAIGDVDGDETPEVLVATTERELAARDPFTGTVVRRYALPSYGYSRPIVTNLTGTPAREVVVVDASGHVLVGDPAGQSIWRRQLEGYAWGQPGVADFDGEPGPELVVGLGGDGGLHLLDADGTGGWNTTPIFDGSITWLAYGRLADTPGHDVVVGTAGGSVSVVDGATGRIRWERDLGRLAAVRAIGDGDGDGTPEVYAVAADGVLRSLDATDGDVEWSTRLADSSDVQMMPPPSLGDVTGDGHPELVAPTNDGVVAVVDPATGIVRARHRRAGRIFAPVTLADADGDGTDEMYVVYADGAVVALRADT